MITIQFVHIRPSKTYAIKENYQRGRIGLCWSGLSDCYMIFLKKYLVFFRFLSTFRNALQQKCINITKRYVPPPGHKSCHPTKITHPVSIWLTRVWYKNKRKPSKCHFDYRQREKYFASFFESLNRQVMTTGG